MSDPGSCSWQCPVLGSTEEVFLLQAGHTQPGSLLQLPVLPGCTDVVMNCTGVLSHGFSAVEVLSPSGSLACPLPSLPVPSCRVLWLIHHGSSQDFFTFSCELLHFFFPVLSVLKAAVLLTSPNYSFSDFLEMVTFIIFTEISLVSSQKDMV